MDELQSLAEKLRAEAFAHPRGVGSLMEMPPAHDILWKDHLVRVIFSVTAAGAFETAHLTVSNVGCDRELDPEILADFTMAFFRPGDEVLMIPRVQRAALYKLMGLKSDHISSIIGKNNQYMVRSPGK